MNVSSSSPAVRANAPASASSPPSAVSRRPDPSPGTPAGPGRVQDGFDPAPSQGIGEAKGPGPAERPAALSDQEILDSAKQFLKNRCGPVPADDAGVRKLLHDNSDLRRDFLYAKGNEDRDRGATSLEMVSNVLQRSRYFLTTGDGKDKKVDGKEVGKDVGLLFAGTAEPYQGVPHVGTQDMNHRWDLNTGHPLPPTGFKQDRLNDDGAPTEDQTHHIAFYAMVGSAWDNWLGEKAAKTAVRVADKDHPNDIRLGDDGIDLGRALDDPKLDVNKWIWDRAGDPGNR